MKRFFFTMAIATCVLNMQAQDWPQFMGPDRNGISKETGILKTWPAEGPKVVWSTDLGIGFGGPVIKAGKVYLLDRDDEQGDIMRCYDLQTGKELWKYAYDAPGFVWIRTEKEGEFFRIDFADTGRRFNPLEENVRGAYDDDEEDCEEGGLGIFLVRKNFDKIKYTYEDFRGKDANILSLWMKMD